MKAKLLRAVDEGRAREADLEAAVVDGPADPEGRWTAKDQLAHLSWWRVRSARNLDAARTGEPLPPRAEDGAQSDAAQNAVIYAENRDRPAADIKADARRSWAALAAAIEACTEEDLAKPHPSYPSSVVWEAVPAADGHVGTHLWFWHLDQGDVDRAEAAAKWAYEIERSFYEEPDKLADATYNLACFYARVGKTDDALRLLRESFRGKPEYREFAGKDPDLDSIRDTAEFKELVAT